MSAENGDPLAQSVEHHTFNVGVLGSNPKRITTKKEVIRLPSLRICQYIRFHFKRREAKDTEVSFFLLPIFHFVWKGVSKNYCTIVPLYLKKALAVIAKASKVKHNP